MANLIVIMTVLWLTVQFSYLNGEQSMKRTAYPLAREEPTLSGAWQSEAHPEDELHPRSVASLPQRRSRLAHWGRGILRLILWVAVIVALSYVPETWIQQQHPHIQDTVHICRDIRDLLYRISADVWVYLQTAVPQWYQTLRDVIGTWLDKG